MNQRNRNPGTTPDASTKASSGSNDAAVPETLDDAAPGERAASGGVRHQPVLTRQAGFPTWTDAPLSSNVRKESVRAALFRKLRPVRIGRFILLEALGAGAMGEIYAAYDEQLDRKVALKLVRSGSEPSAKADERLLREAQTLAQVSHPNVVQIYEAGTFNGRLFIAMELIQGKALSTWLKDAGQVPRPMRQRQILQLFIAAGRGLEAAHAAGVAHRDFKPDNVIVGDDGRVRVVDFGLARALGEEPEAAAGGDLAMNATSPGAVIDARAASADELARGRTITMAHAHTLEGPAGSLAIVTGGMTIDQDPMPAPASSGASDATPSAASRLGTDPGSSAQKLKAAVRLTETGTVMGTPFFMAPEQMRGAIADRRSDQFSFCVALYHGLYDSFPFSGKTLRELSDSMTTDPVEFVPSVPVQVHVRKALARGLSVEPAQRFPGMGELLAALQPARKWRLRSSLAAAAALAAIVLGVLFMGSRATSDPCAAAGAAVDTAWSADRQAAVRAAFARGGSPLAESTWTAVKTRVDDYTGRWRGEATGACQATHVAHTQSAQLLDRRMMCLDRGRREMTALVTELGELGELGTGTSDAVDHAVEAVEALPDLEACSRADDLLFGLEPPPAAVAAKVAAVRDQIAQAFALELMGRYDESQAIARAASATAEHLGYRPVYAEALAQIALTMNVTDSADGRKEAERLYFDALDIAEAERHDELAVDVWNRLAWIATTWDPSMDQAHARWRRNAAAVERMGSTPYHQAKLRHGLAEIYYHESKYSEAADEERQAIASIARVPAHQIELSCYEDGLAKSLEHLDSLDEALQLHEHALALATSALGKSHLTVITLEINYGKALEKSGRLHNARSVLDDALASIPAQARETHREAAVIHGFLSDLDYREGHLDDASAHARESLQIYQQILPPDHPRQAEAYTNLANAEFRRNNFASALNMFENALAIRHRTLGNDHYQTGVNEGSIAETLVELTRYDAAMPHLVEAERVFAHGSGRDRGTQAWLLTVRGEILVGQRKQTSAVPVLEQALELFGSDTSESTGALAMWTLARALHDLKLDPDRVRTLAVRAHDVFVTQGPVAAQRRDATARFLDQLGVRPPRSH